MKPVADKSGMTVKIIPLHPGDFTCGDFFFNLTEVKDGIRGQVDPSNQIKELNEDNNTFTIGSVGAVP